ncbi:hypothetical protein HaLaN_31236 [Haematococcus lacustris]|uniref:Protein kinase domain-containing protein n=1 Tax=Haematococcus lacustris TaxID=44745 RepID=A0A6A0AJN7_HAELA|nr:hypothetical protein HaLaN_31236 [Haematococcus lacustris]
MTDDRVWELISSCWAADPNTRPAMATVAQALQVLAAQQAGLEEAEAAQRQGNRGLLAQCFLVTAELAAGCCRSMWGVSQAAAAAATQQLPE